MKKTRQCKTLHGVDTRVPEKEFQSMLCISVSHHFYTGVAGGSKPPTSREETERFFEGTGVKTEPKAQCVPSDSPL